MNPYHVALRLPADPNDDDVADELQADTLPPPSVPTDVDNLCPNQHPNES